ncbi:hypothetical protein ACVGXV_11935, partial [Enterobacter intestinihominis]
MANIARALAWISSAVSVGSSGGVGACPHLMPKLPITKIALAKKHPCLCSPSKIKRHFFRTVSYTNIRHHHTAAIILYCVLCLKKNGGGGG